MLQYPEDMPLIKPDQSADQTTYERIDSFDKSIHQNPALFIQVLNAMDAESTDISSSIQEHNNSSSILDSDTTKKILDFFFYRDDLNMTFDDKTMQQIKSSDYHQHLLAKAQATKQSPTRIGGENPEAIKARDAARRSRLRIYIGRVAGYEAFRQINSHDIKESMLIDL